MRVRTEVGVISIHLLNKAVIRCDSILFSLMSHCGMGIQAKKAFSATDHEFKMFSELHERINPLLAR